MRTPNSSSSFLHTAPTATRAAVSRALDRSSTRRTSSKPYFRAPTRSAWPGRGLVMSGSSRRQSRFPIHSATGEPMVSPRSTPETISALSCSICIRPPRP